jgi:hypothetical protein
MSEVKNTLIGALIGLSLGINVASFMFFNLFSGIFFTTNFEKAFVILILLTIVTIFSFFGIYCVTHSDTKSGEEK